MMPRARPAQFGTEVKPRQASAITPRRSRSRPLWGGGGRGLLQDDDNRALLQQPLIIPTPLRFREAEVVLGTEMVIFNGRFAFHCRPSEGMASASCASMKRCIS